LSDYPRRRRLEPEPPKSGGIPLVPLIVLVILGGLLLGGLLTRFFGNAANGTRQPASVPSFTPLPGATESGPQPETPSPVPTPSPTSAPSASPSRSAKVSASPAATASAGGTPTASPQATRSAAPHVVAARTTAPPVIIITPSPAPSATPAASPEGTTTPALIAGAASTQHASSIVRSYIGALANGDQSTATGYLASGIPDESFINPNVNVVVSDLRTTQNDDGSFTVTAQIQTAKGSYLETFTLHNGPYGMQITGHSAVRM
jgi:hypothetical protein